MNKWIMGLLLLFATPLTAQVPDPTGTLNAINLSEDEDSIRLRFEVSQACAGDHRWDANLTTYNGFTENRRRTRTLSKGADAFTVHMSMRCASEDRSELSGGALQASYTVSGMGGTEPPTPPDSSLAVRVDSLAAAHAADMAAVNARIDSLHGTPPDTTPPIPPDTVPPIPPDTVPPVTGDTAVVVADSANSVTVTATWTAQPVDETLITRESDPRLNVHGATSPYTFTAPKLAARSLLVAIERWDRSGANPVYIGDDTLAIIDIPAGSGGGTTPPPSGNIKQVAVDLTHNAAAGPNEPAGFTQLDPTVASNWDILYDYGDHQECSPVDGACYENPSRATDSSFPNNPVVATRWGLGFGNDAQWPGSRGRSGGTRMHLRDNSLRHTQSYIRFKFKLDPNHQNGPTGFKVIGVRTPRRGFGINYWFMSLDNNATMALDTKQYCGDTQCPTSPTTFRTGFRWQNDVLYDVELLTKANSAAGVADGRATVWINGVQRFHRTDMITNVDGLGLAVAGSWLVGTILDPIPSARVPAPDVTTLYDDLYVSTR